MTRSLSLLALAATLVVAGCTDTPTPDAPPADSAAVSTADTGPAGGLVAGEGDRAEVLLQNDVVRATRVELAPGDSLSPHEGGARVVYALTPCTVRFEQGGKTVDETFVAGDVHGHPAGRHGLGNTGMMPAEFVVFERLEGTRLPEASQGAPIPDTTGATNALVFNDADAEVHRVTLQPGAALPPHRGYARVLYALNGYTVETGGAGEGRERAFTAGEAHYHAAGDHTVENTGDSVAEFIVVEFKR